MGLQVTLSTPLAGVQAAYHNVKDFNIHGRALFIEGYIDSYLSSEVKNQGEPLMRTPFNIPFSQTVEVTPAVTDENGEVTTPAVTISISIAMSDNLPEKIYAAIKLLIPTFKNATDV